jgi:hypothetical protein
MPAAVVFLYAPFAAAAWSSQAMACCTDGFCNIPKHHHTKAPAHSAATEDCDRHGHEVGGMMDCSMSCCQHPDKLVVTSVAFVLPPVTAAHSATIVTRVVERVHSIETPRTIEPLACSSNGQRDPIRAARFLHSVRFTPAAT